MLWSEFYICFRTLATACQKKVPNDDFDVRQHNSYLIRQNNTTGTAISKRIFMTISAEDYSRIFSRLPGVHLILKANPPHFTILDFTDERAEVTNSTRSTAVGKDLFRRFPDNPGDPHATGVRNLTASLMHVIRTKRPHKMSIQKYDIPAKGAGNFEERYWRPENIPVIGDDGNVEYIIHTVVDVTSTMRLEEEQRKTQSKVENFSTILSKTHNAVVLADADERVQWANDRFVSFLGLEEQHVVGNSLLELLKRIASHEAHCNIEQSIALRQPMECEVENINHSGNWSFAKLETQPIFSPSGRLTAFFAIMTDISELKEAESVIVRNERRNRFIFANISEGIAIMDAEGIIREVSLSGLRILESEPSDLYGRCRDDIVHPEDAAWVQGAFGEVVSGQPEKSAQFRVRLPDGSYKWLEGTYHNFLDEPAIEGVVLTYRDITRRKKDEELLLTSEKNYRYLFNNSPAAIMIWHPATFRVIECNEAAEVLTGYTKEELRMITVFDYRPQEEHASVRSVVNELSKVPFVNNVSSSLITKDGEILYTDNSYHKITFYGQELIMALIMNVTDRRTLQKQIEVEKNRRHLEVTDAVLTAQENERAHLGRELHDNINQILTTAKLYIEHALVEEKMRKMLMESSRDFIASAIKEVRKLSRSLVPGPLDENGLTNALEELVQKVKLVNKTEITTRYGFNEGQLPTKLKLALFRIVQEQLNNIVKHSGASRAWIVIEQVGGDLILTVGDNGVGFDTSARHDGLGFKNILSRATLHGGVLRVSSAVGKGCELTIQFTNQMA